MSLNKNYGDKRIVRLGKVSDWLEQAQINMMTVLIILEWTS